MKAINDYIKEESVYPLFKKVRLGLEKESQRVTLEGVLSKKEHPASLGNRNIHPSIQTDFSETQIELITPVGNSATEVMDFLGALHEVALRSMDKDEMLWPLSMPPILPEQEEDIIIAKLDKFEDVLYRRYLARSYGKRKQMVSGIHYNFEFLPEFVESVYKKQEIYATLEEFKTSLYLKVSRNYLRYRWLVTYLYGASPISEKGYFGDEVRPEEPVRSIRNSKFGYTNHEDVFVSYESMDRYMADIASLIEKGILSEEKEFYSPVRLRGGKSMSDLKESGIQYIEIRNVDINPFAPYGITTDMIEFLHIFLMYMLWIDNKGENGDDLLSKGDLFNNEVALEHPLTSTKLFDEGMSILAGMKEMLDGIEAQKNWYDIIEKATEMLETPAETISGMILNLFESNGTTNHDFGVTKGIEYYEKAWEKPYQLEGYRDMELSTQLLMFDAIKRGVQVEVLDRYDQFLKLTYDNQVEYVKNANMTSKDSYVVPLMMENKIVTKKVLDKAGFRVPQGFEFHTIDEAKLAYGELKNKGIVVKPKSTNYGLGISIFKEGASRKAYEEALEIAFKEDSDVLVEEFLSGTEYRFFVIDGKTKGIILRVPANVLGDGKSTITELVAKKNEDPLRGSHHRAPLELIKLGEIEQLMLGEQGYTVDTVLPAGVKVYLRENSNVSTGGDSIDVTDDFREEYKKIAEEAVTALGAKISGIDLIVPNKEANPFEVPDAYGIIEANFNPAMHMHAYPYEGKGQRLTEDVLDLLFPSSKK